eukprot:gene5613-7753_t
MEDSILETKKKVAQFTMKVIIPLYSIFYLGISTLTVSDGYEEVIFTSEADEIIVTDYQHGDSNSLNHSLTLSDYKSQAGDDSEVVSIVDVNKVKISIESPDPKVLDGICILLKSGSSFADNKWCSYVHMDSWEEFS